MLGLAAARGPAAAATVARAMLARRRRAGGGRARRGSAPREHVHRAARVDGRAVDRGDNYTADFGHPGRLYPTLEEGSIVEPHRPTRLALAEETLAALPEELLLSAAGGGGGGGGGDAPEASASFTWAITQTSNGVRDSRHEGLSVEVTFATLGTYDTTLTASVAGVEVAASRTLVCKYVRRELRKLRDADREAYFDALQTMMSTPTREGARVRRQLPLARLFRRGPHEPRGRPHG